MEVVETNWCQGSADTTPARASSFNVHMTNAGAEFEVSLKLKTVTAKL